MPTTAEAPLRELPGTDDPVDIVPPLQERQTFLRPRRAARRDWLRAGFFATLGAGLMALLAFAGWKFLEATLAVATPFVVGLILAMLLDPLADRLEKRGMGRAAAAGLIFVILLLVIIGAIALVVPALVSQASNLAQNGPQFISGLRDYVDQFLKAHHKIGPLKLPPTFQALTQQMGDQLSGRASGLLQSSTGRIAGVLVGSATFIIQMVLALIITFFLLVDIDRLRARLFYLMPETWRGRMGQIGTDVGGVFSDYLRGLLIVCALYGTATVILLYGLSMVHHSLAQYALLVGVAAGVLYAVPYVGSLTTALVTFLVAFAAGNPSHSGLTFGGTAIVLTLVLNQIFDNVVTPRVVGGGVGLHPVMALFALVLGGEAFGIMGMLFSVPIAASIQVILFRVFPQLTAPTPAPFLRAQGVGLSERESAKTREGDEAADAKKQRIQDA